MPQSKEVHREYMRKLRGSQSITKREGFTAEGSQIDGSQDKGSQDYPPILSALIDPIKRAKLEAIYESLKAHKKADKVFYGYPGLGGVPFNVIGDYLDATINN